MSRLSARWPLPRLPSYGWMAIALLGWLIALYRISLPLEIEGAAKIDKVWTLSLDGTGRGVHQVELPHLLEGNESSWHDREFYVVDWPPALHYDNKQDTHLAVLLPRVGSRFRLMLNGTELFNVGWYSEKGAAVNSAWLPYFVPLPASLLSDRAEDNHINVQVAGELLERSGLWPLQVGNYSVLYKRYNNLFLWQVVGSWMLLVVSMLMAYMSILYWRVMRERLFLVMALTEFANSVYLVFTVLVDPGISFDLYYMLHRTAFSVYIGLLLLLMGELFGYEWRYHKGVAKAILFIGPFWVFVAWFSGSYDFYKAWMSILLVSGLVIMFVYIKNSLGDVPDRINRMMVLVVSVFFFLTGLRDYLVVHWRFPGDSELRWTSLGSLALMLVLGWILMQRATASTREVHVLNNSLETRIAVREAELRTAFDQLRESEQQRAIEHERRRLMRDMHDGLGSQLVQTLNMVRSSRKLDHQDVAQMLQHALEELRMTLDSLEPMEGDLATILGTLRQRIAPALAAAGITLEWCVEEVPPVQRLDSRGVMHLFRCVQEIFANTVKHSGASHVTVRTWNDDAVVYLSVQDNGRGPQPAQSERGGGRGLPNIRIRAVKMGARVRFFDAHPGFGVEFAFHLSDPHVHRTEFHETAPPAL